MNTEIEYWESRADKAHATLDELIRRYENATSDNYKSLLGLIAKTEKEIEFCESEFDKAMSA